MLTPQNAELVKHHRRLSNVVLFARQAYGRPWKDLVEPHRSGWHARRPSERALRPGSGPSRAGTLCGLRVGHRRHRRASGSTAPGAACFTRGASFRSMRSITRGWRAREGSWVAYTHRIPIPTLDAHAIDRYLWLETCLTCPPGLRNSSCRFPNRPSAAWPRCFTRTASRAGPMALLTPGTVWETKHWLQLEFRGGGEVFPEAGWDVVLAGAAPRPPRLCRSSGRMRRCDRPFAAVPRCLSWPPSSDGRGYASPTIRGPCIWRPRWERRWLRSSAPPIPCGWARMEARTRW